MVNFCVQGRAWKRDHWPFLSFEGWCYKPIILQNITQIGQISLVTSLVIWGALQNCWFLGKDRWGQAFCSLKTGEGGAEVGWQKRGSWKGFAGLLQEELPSQRWSSLTWWLFEIISCEVSLRWLRAKGELLPHCFLSVGSVSQEEGFASRNLRQNSISPM